MVGFPYDDLDAWRAIYPPEIFIQQLEKVAGGFEQSLAELKLQSDNVQATHEQRRALQRECGVAEATAIHFRSVANQARFVLNRNTLGKTADAVTVKALNAEIKRLLHSEIALARRLFELQREDSRIGFEASNQYYYVPADLMEKVLNCRNLLARFAQ